MLIPQGMESSRLLYSVEKGTKKTVIREKKVPPNRRREIRSDAGRCLGRNSTERRGSEFSIYSLPDPGFVSDPIFGFYPNCSNRLRSS
jgi:hypothetical protein